MSGNIRRLQTRKTTSGSIVAQGDGIKWAGVGHNSAYTPDGQDYFVAHAYDKETGASKLLIRPIGWEDEWPVIKL